MKMLPHFTSQFLRKKVFLPRRTIGVIDDLLNLLIQFVLDMFHNGICELLISVRSLFTLPFVVKYFLPL